jgi:hypothetical protein
VFRILSIGAFACAVAFNVWGNASTLWTWQLMALIGLLCMAIATRWDTD